MEVFQDRRLWQDGFQRAAHPSAGRATRCQCAQLAAFCHVGVLVGVLLDEVFHRHAVERRAVFLEFIRRDLPVGGRILKRVVHPPVVSLHELGEVLVQRSILASKQAAGDIVAIAVALRVTKEQRGDPALHVVLDDRVM